MGKRCGFINGEIVLMDRAFQQEFDDGTIWTNLTNNEICIKIDGERKVIRIDAGTGVNNVQRIVTKVEKDENDDLHIFYIDLTIVDGVTTEISQEDSYIVGT